MDKDYPIMVKADTKKALSDFKTRNEAKILMNKKRRYVSWDDVIKYLLRGR
jgi:hypothetical protein